MINFYYYNNQIRRYIVQLANVFAGLHVKTGKGSDGTEKMIPVPVHYGSQDRVVASLQTGYTQNKPYSLPMMSLYLTGIEMTPERRKGINGIDRRTILPVGGVFPDDIKVVERLMPIPYDLTFDVSLYASNSDQAFQVIEQILILFDPILQIQTSDKSLDWTKLTIVEMVGIGNEETVPSGTDRRIITWTFNFRVPIWITPPVDVKDHYIQNIIVKTGIYDGETFLEYDENGVLIPFGEIYEETASEFVVTP